MTIWVKRNVSYAKQITYQKYIPKNNPYMYLQFTILLSLPYRRWQICCSNSQMLCSKMLGSIGSKCLDQNWCNGKYIQKQWVVVCSPVLNNMDFSCINWDKLTSSKETAFNCHCKIALETGHSDSNMMSSNVKGIRGPHIKVRETRME